MTDLLVTIIIICSTIGSFIGSFLFHLASRKHKSTSVADGLRKYFDRKEEELNERIKRTKF